MNIHKVLRPFMSFFRARRMKEFESILCVKSNDTILDVGGSKFNWQFINVKPKVLILNLRKPLDWLDDEQFIFLAGDATKLEFSEKSIDIVYSNSVIEHLYTKKRQIEMAN